MAPARIAILASGGGTTAEAFIKSIVTGEVEGKVVLVIFNNQNAGVVERIKNLNREHNLRIKTVHIGKNNYPAEPSEKYEFGRQTAAEEKAILKVLNEAKIDLVLLLGYMKLVGKSIVDKYGWKESYTSIYQGRMINTHPGLLPATKGLFGIHVQERVIENKTNAGNCLFVVDSEYDDGPVVAEHQVEVLPDDDAESLFERVKASEKKHLASDINKFIIEQDLYRRENI